MCELEDLLPGAHVQIQITLNPSLWNPHCTSYADQEAAMTNYKGNMKDTAPISGIPAFTVREDGQLSQDIPTVWVNGMLRTNTQN